MCKGIVALYRTLSRAKADEVRLALDWQGFVVDSVANHLVKSYWLIAQCLFSTMICHA